MQPDSTGTLGQVARSGWWEEFQIRALPVFESAMYVANNILAFDAHRVYAASVVGQLLWSLPTGPITASKGEKGEFERQEEYLAALMTSEAGDDSALSEQIRMRPGMVFDLPRAVLPFVRGSRAYCQAVFGLPEPPPGVPPVPGFISISRRVERGDVNAAEFTVYERHHLRQLAALIEAALGDDAARVILNNLHLDLEHRRKALESADAATVMDEYMLKAARVLHRCADVYLSDAPPDLWKAALRPTIKVVADDGKQLSIRACRTTRPGEWDAPSPGSDVPRRSATYTLNDPGASIAGQVYEKKKWAICTNKYKEYKTSIRIFGDTECHAAAPIVGPNGHVLGVLSIETDERDYYCPAHAAALTVLAASAYAPLKRALSRIDLATKLTVLSDDLMQLWHETRLHKFSEYLEKVLRPTHRVQICVVEPEGRAARPWLSKMPTPDTGYSSDFNPLRCVWVYDVPDSHGVALWVTKIQRIDDDPIGTEDQRVIEQFCRRLTTAYETTRQILLAGLAGRAIESIGFTDFDAILTYIGQGLCGYRVVRRCRVFRLEETVDGRAFVLCNQFGPDQLPDGHHRQTHDSDFVILGHAIPILFLNRGASTELPENSEEFKVQCDGEDPYYHDRSQWVEVRIRLNRRVYKLVFDHAGATRDAFTMGEMRLLAALTRSLAAALSLVEAYHAVASLAIEGLYLDLLTHHHEKLPDQLLADLEALTKNSTSNGDSEKFLRTCKSLRESLDIFRIFDQGFQGTPPSVAEVVRQATDACQFLVTKQFRGLALSSPDSVVALADGSVESPRSLFMLLVTLIENACKFVDKKCSVEPDHRGRIDVGVASNKTVNGRDRITVKVRDNGCGMSDKQVENLRAKFAEPEKYLSEVANSPDGGVGLILASFLAKRWGWKLSVNEPGEYEAGRKEDDGWTVFRVSLECPK